MDSTAYLTKQGWRGDGHSLDPRGRGLKKPVLVSKKHDALGVGKKKNDVHADQWWSRAFDSGLKSLKVGKEHSAAEATNGTTQPQSALHEIVKAQKQGLTKWSGLYGSFVKGDTLSGTMSGQRPLPTSQDCATTRVDAEGSAETDGWTSKETKKSKRPRETESGIERNIQQSDETEAEAKALRKERKRLKAEKRERREKRRKASASA